MLSITEQIDTFKSFIPFLHSLRAVSGDIWTEPFQLGKWSTRDVIAHILLWDQYFEREAIAKLAAGDQLTLKHIEFSTFNQNAITYARAHNQDILIDQAIAIREQIICHIEQLSVNAQSHTYIDGDGHPFTIKNYLEDFIEHDNHHRTEIEYFLQQQPKL